MGGVRELLATETFCPYKNIHSEFFQYIYVIIMMNIRYKYASQFTERTANKLHPYFAYFVVVDCIHIPETEGDNRQGYIVEKRAR